MPGSSTGQATWAMLSAVAKLTQMPTARRRPPCVEWFESQPYDYQNSVLVLVVVCVLALGRRIPPVMAGIVLLATA
ncbi:MAG: hypothetical protein ACRDIE_05875, partial [Chloroflexota bacterium]